MNTANGIKRLIVHAFARVAPLNGVIPRVTTECVLLEHPDNMTHGDYSTNIALLWAKSLSASPKEIAEKIKSEILELIKEEGVTDIETVEVAGPGFINFFLSKNFFAHSLQEIIKAENFGHTTVWKDKVWEIEHTSPNPNKAMHLGHLRNNVTGMVISNILEANGARVIREEVDNNRGIAIAKLMWGFLKFGKKEGVNTDVEYWSLHRDEWHTPQTLGLKPDRFVDGFYIRGSEDFKNPDVEKVVRNIVVLWESEDETVWNLWKHVLSYAYEGQRQTLERLGNKWDYVWHEHEHYKQGKLLVEEGLKKGVFNRLEDGAILTNLEKYGLSDTIVQKSDGTALYITQDIALTKLKKDKFNADFMAWVIGPEQSLAMQQLFAVCDALGIGSFGNFLHISYGYMSIKGKGKMSSREGTVLYIDDILDEAKNVVMSKITKNFTKEEKEIIAEKVALGAVKFSILKSGRTTDTAFDFDTSLNLEGDSGPYLQYSLVRAFSVLEKADASSDLFVEVGDLLPLVKYLYRFPEVVARAGTDLAPNHITVYLLELAAAFNSFYAQGLIVSDAPDSPYKVAVTKAFSIVMKNGLGILGIPVLRKM